MIVGSRTPHISHLLHLIIIHATFLTVMVATLEEPSKHIHTLHTYTSDSIIHVHLLMWNVQCCFRGSLEGIHMIVVHMVGVVPSSALRIARALCPLGLLLSSTSFSLCSSHSLNLVCNFLHLSKFFYNPIKGTLCLCLP